MRIEYARFGWNGGVTRALAKVAITNAGNCSAGTTMPTNRCLLATVTQTPDGVLDGVASSIANTTANMKVTEPQWPVTGTIVFVSGGGSRILWENLFTTAPAGYMRPAVNRGQRLIQLAYATMEWDDGAVGPLALACRTASILKAIHDDESLYTPGTPFIACGTSAGASQIAYALCHYGAGAWIDLAQISAGPIHTRLDYGTYGTGDPTWASIGPPLCTTGSIITYNSISYTQLQSAYDPRTFIASIACNGGIDNPGVRDSIDRIDAAWHFPQTVVNAVYGDNDVTTGPPLGRYWLSKVTSTKTESITTGNVDHDGTPDSVSGNAFINAAFAAAEYLHGESFGSGFGRTDGRGRKRPSRVTYADYANRQEFAQAVNAGALMASIEMPRSTTAKIGEVAGNSEMADDELLLLALTRLLH